MVNTRIRRWLRRYTNLPAVIYLLTERKITLVDPETWDDSNDSQYLRVHREGKNLKSVLALCFSRVKIICSRIPAQKEKTPRRSHRDAPFDVRVDFGGMALTSNLRPLASAS